MAQLAMPITLGLRAPLQLSHAPRAAPARRRVLVRAAVAPEALEAASTLVYEAPSLTWQAAVGAVAGFFPFVIASIEFGKRIAAQRRCQVCNGSGLELIGRYYRRCTGCGGFLPWQDWRRFFTG